ncbi:MAG TPA: Cna B-type domain-containing protein [Candidatus Ligilactobacillus excrementipullorum]|nr:Cna B-type domain-containing protein [Candidatus Ligilactobacillus excrementipullorum]
MSSRTGKYLTRLYAILMSLTLVAQLFAPILQVTAAEVPTGITKLAAKSTGDNEAELDLSLYNPSEEKRTEKIAVSPDALVKDNATSSLVSLAGENVGTYQVKDHEITVNINANVTAQAKLGVSFAEDNTATTATFTSGNLAATVNLPNTQNETSAESATSSSQATSSSSSVASSSSSSVSSSSSSSSAVKATDETTQAKKAPSVSKAAAAQSANDISQYLPASSNGTIITGADIKFTDKDDHLVDPKDVNADTNVSFAYTWAIPDELKDDYQIQDGDYFEFKLPENVSYRAGTGSLDDYGTYEIKSDGTVRFTFNSTVEDKNNVHGTFNYNHAQINVTEPGKTTIDVPTTSGPQKTEVIVNPTGGNDIAKSGTVSPAKNPQNVNWQVDINTNGKTLTNATIKDNLPDGLKLTGTQVYSLNVDLKGNIIGEDTQLIEGTDYSVDSNGTVKLIGAYAETQQAFRIKYATEIESAAIPNDGGNVKFENNATLTNDGHDYSAQATVTASYGKLLEKSYKGAEGSQKLNWEINYNAGDKKLPAGTKLTDKLSDNQKYIGTPKLVYTDGPNNGKDVVAGDYKITYTSDQEMIITFTNGLEQAVKITYQTQIIDPIKGSTNISNSATSDGKTETVGDKVVGEQGLVKSLGAVDYNAKTAAWNVTINQGRQEMKNWSAEDTIPAGLTLQDDDSFVLNDVTTNKNLVRGTDYKFEKTATGFKIELLGAYRTTSDEFLLTYKTQFDTKQLTGDKWTNKIAATWTDKNNEKHHNNGSADFKPKAEFVTDGTKSGSYNAINKHITWTVVANYNQRELKNAKIVDVLQGDPKYVDGSAKLYEATINPNGSYKLGNQVTASQINFDNDSKTLTDSLPDSSKAYVLVFETSLEGQVIDAPSYANTAQYWNDGDKKDLTAKVSVPNSGKVAYKTGKQDPTDSAYAVWDVTVNPEQSTLKDVTVVDQPSTNQVLNQDDVVVYGIKVATNGAITVDPSNKLEEGKDYSLVIETDQTTGKQVMTVKFLNEISTAYSLHYRTLINSSKTNDSLSNNVTVTGRGQKEVNGTTTTSTTVVNNSGTATGENLNYQLTKVDQDDPAKVLTGVKFELWSFKNGAKGQLLRSGTTDNQGKISWNNLKAGKYVLVEAETPADYQTSADKVITIAKDSANSADLVGQTITNEKVKTSISGTKTWKDNDDQDGKRPSQISVNLLANGEKVASKTVTAKDGWKYSFSNLAKFKDGKEIKYTVQEEKVPGYTTTYDGVDITNTHEAEKTSVSGTKTWKDQDDQDGKRPSEITVNLLANGEKVATKTVTAKDDWKYSFSGLDKYKAGKEIKYTVQEEAVAGYETTYNGVDITNTHQVEKTGISGTKTWNDNDDQDGKRPSQITINLLANGEKVASKTVTAKDSWKYSFSNLDKYQAGKEIKYTIEEEKVAGYEGSYTGVNITNTHEIEKTSVSGTKTWKDQDDQDGKRPSEITVNLLANGEKVATKTVTAKDDWKYKFSDLDKYKAGKEIKYTVEENPVAGYTTTYDGVDITNTHEVEKTSISGQKTWKDNDDQDGNRPDSITLHLLKNGKEIDSKTVTAADDWKYSFTDLDKYAAGKEVVYTVTEDQVNDYTSDVTDAKNIINNYTPGKTSATVTKSWDDTNNQDGLRTSVKVQLYANGQEFGEPVELNQDNNWTYTWTDLNQRQGKKDIKYTVQEVNVPAGYTAKVNDDDQGNMIITNTHQVAKTSVSGQKTWKDNNDQDGKRPSEITVNLLADGEKVATKTVTAKDNWKYSFNDLDQFKAGKEIKYTVQEDPVAGYETTYDGVDIINTHEVEKTSVSGQKTWKDHNDQDGKRPSEITVNLLADGQKVATKTVTAKDDWKYSFDDLDKFKAGKEIKYTVQEDPVAGYETTYDGVDITNTHEVERTSVSGTKTWKDQDDQDGKRPSEINVNLLADGEKVASKTVTAKDNWKYSFNDLDQFKAGKEIKYTVEEEPVAGYTTTYDGVDITNTHEVAQTNISGQKTWKDNDDQDGKRPNEITVNLLADGEKVASKTVTAKDGWKYEFTNLDQFKNGKQIKYTISEDKVAGYATQVNGYNLTNTLKNDSKVVVNHQHNNNSKGNSNHPGHKKKHGIFAFLPKTGEMKTTNFVVTGLLIAVIILSGVVYVFGRKSRKEER